MNVEPILLTIDETTTLLGVGRTTLYQLMDSGALRSVHVGKKRLIRREDAEAFVRDLPGVVEEADDSGQRRLIRKTSR